MNEDEAMACEECGGDICDSCTETNCPSLGGIDEFGEE